MHCVVIDPQEGGYAQDLRQPTVFKALAVWLQSDHIHTILACPNCGWWCALQGEGLKQSGKVMPAGPGVILNSDHPDGIKDERGVIVPEAKAALNLWMIVFTLLDVAVAKCGCKVIIEHPVKRGGNSPFAIPGKEWHTTVYDTSIGKKAIEVLKLKVVPFDQGAPPINASTQKTTSFHCTPKIYPLVMRKFGSLKVSPMLGKSLKGGADRAGVQFATKGSEVYTPGMCKMIVELAQEYTRQLLSTAIKLPSKQMAHQMELRIGAQNANTSLVKASEYGWRPKTSKALLDSGADAHIWIDRDAYLTLEPPDIPFIGVGKDGEKVDFIAMGTVLMGMTMTAKNGDQVPKGMLIEKAYLPKKGYSAINIIQCINGTLV
jgi:hypothetical protein